MAHRTSLPPRLLALNRASATPRWPAGWSPRTACAARPWRRLLREVYVHLDVPLIPTVRIDALRLAVPVDAVLCGRTAAWMYGVWEPPPGRPLPLEHTRPVTSTGRRLARTSRRRLVLGDEVEDLGGVRATSPLRTCFELTRDRGLVEAVVAVDAFAAAEVMASAVEPGYQPRPA